MAHRIGVGVDEWHHCYTRGIDHRKTFREKRDYERFIELMYLVNSEQSLHRSDSFLRHEDILAKKRGNPLVAIGAYCLMPNHFHILMQEVAEAGIARFMQKLGTAYTMYFNKKNERIGSLFIGPFRSRHIDTDNYLRHVTQYIHLNPADIYERQWKDGIIKNHQALEKNLKLYTFSSLQDYIGTKRIARTILSEDAMQTIGALPPLGRVIHDAAEYYAHLNL